jgi:Helix-loop-helix DNA-binding domain
VSTRVSPFETLPDLASFTFYISNAALLALIIMAFLRNPQADEPAWNEYDFTAVFPIFQDQEERTNHFDDQTVMNTMDYSTMMGGCDDHLPSSVPTLYQTGPFTISDLQEMSPDASSSSHTNQSSYRGHSRLPPGEVQTSPCSLPPQPEKVCPILAGQSLHCPPQLCGSDAACLDGSNIPDLEDCNSVPCIEKLSDAIKFPYAPQPSPIHTIDTRPHSSTLPSRRQPSKNLRQHPQPTNSHDSSVNAHTRKAHSLVERRYRENLNGSIAKLHQTLLSTKRFGRTVPEDQEDASDEQQQSSSKLRKSDIMLQAVDYVHQTEVEFRHMADEIELLTTRVRQLEKQANCDDCVLMQRLVNCTL